MTTELHVIEGRLYAFCAAVYGGHVYLSRVEVSPEWAETQGSRRARHAIQQSWLELNSVFVELLKDKAKKGGARE